MKNFSGKVLFLDRSDINTDEIIPAKYLTEITKEAIGPHLLEDLCLEGFTPGQSTRDKQAVITRANFGCGSSREHAPWALEATGRSERFPFKIAPFDRALVEAGGWVEYADLHY